MIIEEIRNAIQKRMSIDDEWDYGVEQCWKKEIELLSQNINETITFLENDCTAEEFSWLSEIFEEVAKRTQSRAFVNCLFQVAEKYQDVCNEFHIDLVLRYAEGAIEDD